jgi:hypothetical protein
MLPFPLAVASRSALDQVVDFKVESGTRNPLKKQLFKLERIFERSKDTKDLKIPSDVTKRAWWD